MFKRIAISLIGQRNWVYQQLLVAKISMWLKETWLSCWYSHPMRAINKVTGKSHGIYRAEDITVEGSGYVFEPVRRISISTLVPYLAIIAAAPFIWYCGWETRVETIPVSTEQGLILKKDYAWEWWGIRFPSYRVKTEYPSHYRSEISDEDREAALSEGMVPSERWRERRARREGGSTGIDQSKK